MEEEQQAQIINYLEDEDARMEFLTENYLDGFIEDGDKIHESNLQSIIGSVCEHYEVEALTMEDQKEAKTNLDMLDGEKDDTITLEVFKKKISKMIFYALKDKYCD